MAYEIHNLENSCDIAFISVKSRKFVYLNHQFPNKKAHHNILCLNPAGNLLSNISDIAKKAEIKVSCKKSKLLLASIYTNRKNLQCNLDYNKYPCR
jgi:hypothetical protein